VIKSLDADFFAGIGFLLAKTDRVRFLRLSLGLAEPGTADHARILFELLPFLSVDDKIRYGKKALDSADQCLSDLVILVCCIDYLPREDTIEKLKSCVKSLEHAIFLGDFDGTSEGFASFVLQQALASTMEYEIDSVSAIANIVRQEEFLCDALKFLEKSALWSSRIKLAQAWILYSQAIRTSRHRMLELFRQSNRKVVAALKVLQGLNDYESLYSGCRLQFLMNYRVFLSSDLKARETGLFYRRMKKYSELSGKYAEAITDPVKLASANSNIGVTLWGQAQVISNLGKRRRLLEDAREKYLKAVLAFKQVDNDELAQKALFNAGNVLIFLSTLEQNVVKHSELLESALNEFDGVIRSSSVSNSPRIRVSAIAGKLLCMEELARINPVNVTNEVMMELDRLGRELDELRPRSYDSYLFACAYEDLSLYCLRLVRVRGKEQKELLDKAEESASKGLEIAEKVPLYDMIGTGLYSIATTQMIRAVMTHNVRLLTEAGRTAKKAAEVLERVGGIRFLIPESIGIEVQVVKYGYTGDQGDLDKAIDLSRKAVPEYTAHKYSQIAGEESFRLATLYMLRGADRKAEQALNEATRLFRRSGREDPRFSKESKGYSITCTATRRLVQAQMAFKAGKKTRAIKLVEEAEREMISAKARWREVWLIRGFKELIRGNLQEARTNLSRIIKESLDFLEETNPTSTGYTARRLVEFMNQRNGKRQALPPTAIDLPLKSEAILAALRLETLSKQISTASAAGAYVEARELDMEGIRDIIKRMMETENRGEKKDI
jgi:tetratricopeptide (TPR) repeat protein